MNDREHSEVSDLLGAWAVDACGPEEVVRIEHHIAACDTCNDEAKRLRKVATSMADELGTQPAPFFLRSRVLDAARSRRAGHHARPGLVSPEEAYCAEVEALDSVLASLSASQWNSLTINGWSVRDTVVHLNTVDELLLSGDEVVKTDLEALTSSAIANLRDETSKAIHHRWRATADRIVNQAATDGAGREMNWFGLRMVLGQVVADRAFETWLHGQDIRQSAQVSPSTPKPEHLAMLTDVGARLIPEVARRDPSEFQASCARLVLTGEGGGSWLIPLGENAPLEPRATVTVDSLEFCYLIGGRREVAALPHEVDGDAATGERLLATARALSRL